jgi:hypothetical protein
MGGTLEVSQTRDALVRKAGATLLFTTRASKLLLLKRVRLIKILPHEGTGVTVGVNVFVGVNVMVGVEVIVGVKVGVRVLVGVRVNVGVKVNVGVNVGEGSGVLVGTVTINENGVLIARVPRNCSTMPSR